VSISDSTCGTKLRPPVAARSAACAARGRQRAAVVLAHHRGGQRFGHREHVGGRFHEGKRRTCFGGAQRRGDRVHRQRHAHMSLAVSVGDSGKVQRAAEVAQPGGQCRGFADQVGTALRDVVATGARRCDERGVAGANPIGDGQPDRRARQVDRDDPRAPPRQPRQRPGFAAGAEQDDRAVRQVEPLGAGQRSAQRLRMRRFGDALGFPTVDLLRQRVAMQPAPPMRHFPTGRRRVAGAGKGDGIETNAARAGHRIGQPGHAPAAQERQLGPRGVEPGLTRVKHRVRQGSLRGDERAPMHRVAVAPIGLGGGARSERVERAECRADDPLARGHGAAPALLVGGKLNAL
jgi:hypothetical protein